MVPRTFRPHNYMGAFFNALKTERVGLNVFKNRNVNFVLCCYGIGRNQLQKARHRCKQLCPRRTFCRPVAYCFRLRNIILFGCYLCGLCRTIRVEVRPCVYMDWPRKCRTRLASCLGGLGKKNPSYDSALRECDNA